MLNIITPEDVGKTIKLHNGKIFKYVYITNKHIGHNKSEFIFTRKPAVFKKKKKS